jgi:hypothetical protein
MSILWEDQQLQGSDLLGFDSNFPNILSKVIVVLQVDVDIGSSTVANGVLGLVFGVVTSLVVDMAFLVQVCSLALF